jgi:hypothetical protein
MFSIRGMGLYVIIKSHLTKIQYGFQPLGLARYEGWPQSPITELVWFVSAHDS